MSMQFSVTRAGSAQDQCLANINNVGSAVGVVKFYTGAEPANAAATATGTLLSTCSIGSNASAAFGNTNTGTLVATGQTTAGYFAQDTNPANTGTAGYARILDYAGVTVGQGTVGLAGSGADFIFNTLTITAGVLVQITSCTMTISGIV